MTKQQAKDHIKRIAAWSAVLFPALAGAWTIAKSVGATKLDVTRFVQDSAVVMARDSVWKAGVVDGLHDLKSAVDSANLRLRQIQCGARVETGCR